MHLPPSRANDEQFWLSFVAQVKKIDLLATETDLPSEWWNWPLLERAEDLLEKVRHLAVPFDEQLISTVIVSALLICNQKSLVFQAALHERIIALRTLVSLKGRDYNAGG